VGGINSVCVRECTLQLKVNLHKPANLLLWQVQIRPIVHLSIILSAMHLIIHMYIRGVLLMFNTREVTRGLEKKRPGPTSGPPDGDFYSTW
jgi:hypothetical protein